MKIFRNLLKINRVIEYFRNKVFKKNMENHEKKI